MDEVWRAVHGRVSARFGGASGETDGRRRERGETIFDEILATVTLWPKPPDKSRLARFACAVAARPQLHAINNDESESARGALSLANAARGSMVRGL